ncbi:methyltransferase domain-containing protein [Thalassotalea litorea]|uniref:Methyltransferase domain-containing protein n=1 Tax=Thalassotalea litorea TaxID=2020715 RepID=A0A5R9IIH6_9GAMM|nr:class I SAM-dependent methyltransferase [Thalassotalea litorea]TLU61107.1 methyltransferase domain-containing protein [Thalassotalea litorea]
MKPALAFKDPEVPIKWEDMPNGVLVANAISESMQPWWPRIFGYHLLKLGSLSAQLDTSKAMIKHQVNVCHSHPFGDVLAEIDDLPFQLHSVDACVLAHSLEFALDPHHILREIDRVLIPNGHLLISGFNPNSLAGLNRYIPFRRNAIPWQGRFFTPMRIKDWLNLLGYEILADDRFLHSSLVNPLDQKGWLGKHWQKFASNYLRMFGSVFLIVAKKRVHPLTPIRPKWQLRPNFQPVKVTSMQGHSRQQ